MSSLEGNVLPIPDTAGLGSRLIFFRLRLLVFFQAAPAPRFFKGSSLGSLFFFSAGFGSKAPKTPGSDRLLLPRPLRQSSKVIFFNKSVTLYD